MDRREFLIGAMTLAGGAASPRLLAHTRRYDAAGSGANLLLSVGVASRGSRAWDRGLSVNVSVASPSRAGYGSVDFALRRLGDSVRHSDLRRLERNLDRLADQLGDALDRRQAHHFCSHWHHHHGTVFEARAHLDSCGACRGAWKVVIRGTGVDLIPFHYSEEVTVVAPPQGPDPMRELHLPEVPNALRPALAGKQIRLKVCVDEYGVASVRRVYSPGVSDFVVQRAVEQVERTPWIAAANRRGRPIDDIVRVVFHWQT